MPRVAISEFKAKSIVYKFLNQEYKGIRVGKKDLIKNTKALSSKKHFIVKVDEGVKKRQNNHLLFKNVSKNDLTECARKLFHKGYSFVLIEEYVPHDLKEEKFIAMNRVREGIMVYFSNKGGVDVELQEKNLKAVIYSDKSSKEISKYLQINKRDLDTLIVCFDRCYFSFLESNPFIVRKDKLVFLDLAVEVDSAANFAISDMWNTDDLVTKSYNLTEEELTAKALAEKSSASFKLDVLNRDGNIFTIFSGGGASIVLADEIYSKGKANNIVNYAEYSGNPNEEETYLFVKIILSLVKKSKAKNKAIYIAGGVANFTDIRTTFRGVIRALDEDSMILKKDKVKVLVRRGGPHQEEGLEMMRDFLKEKNIQGKVYGPDLVLTDIVE